MSAKTRFPEGFYASPRYNAARGGHAPGHLRGAFCDWADAVYDWDDVRRAAVDPLVVATEDGRQCPLRWLIGQLWNCTDIMPSQLCEDLDLPLGSTYARAVHKAAQEYL
jgi:hypothetical protein